ncbi:unnamed protein product [Adineta steineri]|uniref:Deoxyhypusine hydroxylase n=1 Tax=Adineta steineri TaxID=433720 RepID=A0A815TYS6_9BILA|nr:unnamed protein product [Adineta steineri]CAF1512551.1 unnamed protein product [Adineta steineri]CAF1647723.1 unnamed protein product [Adineta steineri]CAF3795971.1 unnamed protein product [Adineta steineri]CAF4031340.1 unnamed protein product [Adineta steineri]
MSPITNEATIEKLSTMLVDTSLPLKLRFRILFTLKSLGSQNEQQLEKTSEIVDAISAAFNDTSALLKHECAYCLGQMGDKYAINKLIQVLNDSNEDSMVRHEAGEALGALGCFDNSDVVDALTKQSQNPRAEISETCQIALDRLAWLRKTASNNESSSNSKETVYTTVDPAPPLPPTTIDELKTILLDENRSLFERYRAMFALRNIGSDEAVLAICEGFKASSALFRHEIAFVLGQLQSICSIPALHQQLSILDENYMVRHECAETLGSIGTDECRHILEDYLHDKERVVRESCEVALDIVDYVNSKDFQYCNGLKLVDSECC